MLTIKQFPGDDLRKIDAEIKGWIAQQPTGTKILNVERLINVPTPPTVMIYQVTYLPPN